MLLPLLPPLLLPPLLPLLPLLLLLGEHFRFLLIILFSPCMQVIAGFTIHTTPPANEHVRVLNGVFKSKSEVNKFDKKGVSGILSHI